MKFPPKCRTKKLGMIRIILGSFCSCLNWEGADIRPQIRPRKIPEGAYVIITEISYASPNYYPPLNREELNGYIYETHL